MFAFIHTREHVTEEVEGEIVIIVVAPKAGPHGLLRFVNGRPVARL